MGEELERGQKITRETFQHSSRSWKSSSGELPHGSVGKVTAYDTRSGAGGETGVSLLTAML